MLTWIDSMSGYEFGSWILLVSVAWGALMLLAGYLIDRYD